MWVSRQQWNELVGALVGVNDKLKSINSRLNRMETKQEVELANLKEVREHMGSLTSVVQSAVTLIDGLQDRVANLEPNQEDIDALAAEIGANKDSLVQAMLENTSAASELPPAGGPTGGGEGVAQP